MDNNQIPVQPVVEAPPEVQKTGVGVRRFSIPRKAWATLLVALAILGGGIGVAVYQNAKNTVTTTGAVIAAATSNPEDPYTQLYKLLDLGTYKGNGFSFQPVSHSTEVAVFLDAPYDKNQAVFQDWLKSNGYGNIPQDQIVYFHNP